MTYANPHGEFDDSRDVMLGSTYASAWLSYLGIKSTTLARLDALNSIQAAAERGVGEQLISTWRQLVEDYTAADDAESLVALQLTVDGYTSKGNLGPVTQQAADAITKVQKDVEDALDKAKTAASSAASTVLWAGLGLALVYVVVKARSN